MTIEELGELTERGFTGIHDRLDALNGRTRTNEVAVGELRARTYQYDGYDPRLRAVETSSAVASALVSDIKGAGRTAGLKWGTVASGALTLALYIVAWLAGFQLPK